MAHDIEVNIDWFLADTHKFPWDLINLHYPRVGSVHSYLCSVIARFANEYERQFLLSRPTWRELRRFAKDHEGMSAYICAYCEKLYELLPSERTDVAHEVLDFLRQNSYFRRYFKQLLERLHKQGIIKLPKGSYYYTT